MTEVTREFNNLSADDKMAALERDRAKLDRDGQELVVQHLQLWKQDQTALDERLSGTRVDRIAINANSYAGTGRYELGTERPREITQEDVKAMMLRAEQQGLPLDQLTPTSLQDQHIQKGAEKARQYEERQHVELGRKAFDSVRQLVDNLLSPELRMDGRDRGGNDGNDGGRGGLGGTFDRHR